MRSAPRLRLAGTAKTPAYFHAGYSASKSALHGFFDSMRAELRASGRGGVSISMLVLGMIGTPEVMDEPNLRAMAMPVSDCVNSMICAERARVEEAFVPAYIWFVVRLNSFLPGVADLIMRNMYVYQVPSFVQRLEAAAEGSVAERLNLPNNA
jgi:short-subunit dehydrogenase